jgi:S-adenosylhomocysteine hydrolase
MASVKKELSQTVNVITPNKVDDIPAILESMAQKWGENNIILIEIGGYSSFVSHKLENILFTVEDTNQGHWNHLKNKNRCKVPVISIAQTEVKKLENRVVEESIVKVIEKLLVENFPNKSITNQTFGVISYGGIGGSVALALRNRQVAPLVHDIDPVRSAFACADGYRIAQKKKLLQICDIVIACTGESSILLEDSKDINKGALLFSGSSKQIEFQELFALEKSKKFNSKFFEQYFSDGSFFYIANKGQPINFLDNVDPENFDYIMGAIAASVKYGLESKLENKIYSLPMNYQIPIFEMFNRGREV